MNIINYNTIEIETERLILKKGSIEDFISVYEYDMRKVRDISGEFELKKQDPIIIRSWFTESAEEYYRKCETENHSLDWIIYLKSNMLPIGNITADRENKELNSCELSFNLHPSYWGQGYMPEAIKNVLNHLFNIGYENVLYIYDEGNNKSKRVSEKLGFQLYKINKESWFKNDKSIDTYETIMNKEKWFEQLNKVNTK